MKADYSNPDNLEENYNLDYVSYDLNGNITGLQRHGLVSLERERENLIKKYDLIDRLSYNYGNQAETYSNRLLAVDDKVETNGVANDFNDFGSYQNKEYNYDLNGNMTYDANKKINISYNHINLPHTIDFSEGQKIRNAYLAAGSKIRTERITSKGISTYTDYVQEFVYENDTLRFFPMEEGRVVFQDNGTPKLEYHYKDHLGNLRLAFEVEEIEVSFLLTMEADSAKKEEEQFENVAEARTDLKDKEGHYSAALTGANKAISKTIQVKKGDRIKASVFATHDPTIADTDPEKAIAEAKKDVLLSLGGVVAGSINTNQIEQKIEIPVDPEISPAQTIITKSPKVQLNLLDFVPVIRNLRALKRVQKAKALEPDMYFVPKGELVLELRDSTDSLIFEKRERLTISSAVSWEKLVSDLDIKEDGNLKVYIDNSDSETMYFDYLKIEKSSITRAIVIQENHYYPFGMNMKGIEELDLQSLDNEEEHRWQFNGVEKNESFGLNWNETFYRTYDSQLGRWNAVDSKPTYEHTTYMGMGNNPMKYNDVLGDTVRYDDAGFNDAFAGGLPNKWKEVVDTQIQRMRNTPEGEARYQELQQSEHDFIITYRHQPHGATEGNQAKAFNEENASNGVGTGGIIYWDPMAMNGDVDETGFTERDPMVALAHEFLGHGIQFNRGNRNRTVVQNTENKGQEGLHSEIEAAHIENIVRAANGQNLRKYYNGEKIIIENGNKKKVSIKIDLLNGNPLFPNHDYEQYKD